MASGVHIVAPTCTDVLTEPFNDLSAWANQGCSIVAGRTGTAVQGDTSGDQVDYTIPSVSRSDYLTVGFAFKTNDISDNIIFMYRSGAAANLEITVDVLSDGRLRVLRQVNNLLAQTSSGAITINTWYYFELQIRHHSTLGSVVGRLNDVQVLAATNVNTFNGGQIDTMRLVRDTGAIIQFDDLYLSTGPTCTFKGDPVSCTDVLTEPFNDLTNWTTITGTPTIIAGRTGTALRLGDASGAAAVAYSISSGNQLDTITIGFAWRISNITSRDIMGFWSDSNTVEHTTLKLVSDGSFSFVRGAGGIGSTVAGLAVVNTWSYLEIKIKLHDTAGSIIFNHNGVEVLNVSSIDTKNAGTKTVYDAIRLYGYPSASNNQQYDDLYLSAGSGCTFKGDLASVGVYSDNFNRADNSSLGANWSVLDGNISISSNKAQHTSGASKYRWATAVAANHWSEGDCVATSGDSSLGPAVRMQDLQNYYYSWIQLISGPLIQIWSVVGGTYTQLGSTSIASGTAKVRMEAEGTSIRVYVDNVLKLNVTDSALSSGGIGMAGYAVGTPPTLDNWRGGVLPYPS